MPCRCSKTTSARAATGELAALGAHQTDQHGGDGLEALAAAATATGNGDEHATWMAMRP